MVSWIFAALHLIALPIGFSAIVGRSRALRAPLDAAGLKRVFAQDTWWAIAAVLWIGTGVFRAFMPLEKGALYYMQNHVFWGKMALLAIILALEVWPMATLIRWRVQLRRGEAPDTTQSRALATVSTVQGVLVLLMVLAATAMARGIGK